MKCFSYYVLDLETDVGGVFFINLQIIVWNCAGIHRESIHGSNTLPKESGTRRNTEACLSRYGANRCASVTTLTLHNIRLNRHKTLVEIFPYAQMCSSAQITTLRLSLLGRECSPLRRMSVAWA